MKKIVLSLLVLASGISANAQSYVGFFQDNYAGVQSVLFNPSSIVDSRFKADINLFSVSASANNDAYGVKLSDVTKSNYDFDTEAKKSFSTNNNVAFNFDVMGPAFMFNLAPKHSIAVFTRARAFVNVLQVNGAVVNDLTKSSFNSFPAASLGSPNGVANSWGELGLSYAAVLYQKGAHFVKGGITAKYLQGVANYHLQGTNVTVQHTDSPNPAASSYTTTGTAIYGSSQDFSASTDINIDRKSTGFGFDLGVTYEWRPEYDASRADINDLKYVNKYKLRVGLSLTDLGSMSYDKGVRTNLDLNKMVSEADFNAATNFDDFIKTEYGASTVNGALKAYLPTAFHADVDYNIHNKFYINLNGDVSAVDKGKLNQSSVANRVSITPRYESKWFSFYVPISYFEYSNQPLVGAGLRTGVFFIGSGSVLSNVVSSSSKGADFYMGVKIPFYQKKNKEVVAPIEEVVEAKVVEVDTDNDGILDKDDKCPNVAGPKENNGCPYLDADNDGVLDKDDKCPTVSGPKENAGCPWQDTDGDGVADKDDKCPTVKGTAANKGCPEVNKEVINKLNDYSKAIMFDSGKSTIRFQSTVKLIAILEVMNEYSNSTFQLNGYTDSTGVAAKNLQLSKDRAAAIKNYLVTNGISADRLTSEGFGIENPIASNSTAEGRALNRRVEIILVK